MVGDGLLLFTMTFDLRLMSFFKVTDVMVLFEVVALDARLPE